MFVSTAKTACCFWSDYTLPFSHCMLLCRQVMSAPNLLRVGTPENIFEECQDCTGGDITVEIIVLNHPTKNMRLASTTVTLTWTKDFQELGQIMVHETLFL